MVQFVSKFIVLAFILGDSLLFVSAGWNAGIIFKEVEKVLKTEEGHDAATQAETSVKFKILRDNEEFGEIIRYWVLDFNPEEPRVIVGAAAAHFDAEADVIIHDSDLSKLFKQELDLVQAYKEEKLKFSGNMIKAMKVEPVMILAGAALYNKETHGGEL